MKISRFICKYRFIMLSAVFGIVLLIVVTAFFSIDSSTNKMIVEYIEDIGWEIEDSPMEISHLTIPENFDAVYQTYNALQKQSGLSFEDFKGKKVTRYTYRVLNHKESRKSQVVAGVFVFENTIIGADISSADSNGFMHAITDTTNMQE